MNDLLALNSTKEKQHQHRVVGWDLSHRLDDLFAEFKSLLDRHDASRAIDNGMLVDEFLTYNLLEHLEGVEEYDKDSALEYAIKNRINRISASTILVSFDDYAKSKNIRFGREAALTYFGHSELLDSYIEMSDYKEVHHAGAGNRLLGLTSSHENSELSLKVSRKMMNALEARHLIYMCRYWEKISDLKKQTPELMEPSSLLIPKGGGSWKYKKGDDLKRAMIQLMEEEYKNNNKVTKYGKLFELLSDSQELLIKFDIKYDAESKSFQFDKDSGSASVDKEAFRQRFKRLADD